uniref:CUB domain-containing protein n=1 Tax=Steinernema glaseri TaxID=37863 RepID=A0A1I7Y3N7_9BILA
MSGIRSLGEKMGQKAESQVERFLLTGVAEDEDGQGSSGQGLRREKSKKKERSGVTGKARAKERTPITGAKEQSSQRQIVRNSGQRTKAESKGKGFEKLTGRANGHGIRAGSRTARFTRSSVHSTLYSRAFAGRTSQPINQLHSRGPTMSSLAILFFAVVHASWSSANPPAVLCDPGDILKNDSLQILYTSCRDLYLFTERRRDEGFADPFCENREAKMFVSKRGVVHLIFSSQESSRPQVVAYTLFDFPEKGHEGEVLERTSIRGVCHPEKATFHSEKVFFENVDFDIATKVTTKKLATAASGCSPRSSSSLYVNVLNGDVWVQRDRPNAVIQHVVGDSFTLEQRFEKTRFFYWITPGQSQAECIFSTKEAESIIVVFSDFSKYIYQPAFEESLGKSMSFSTHSSDLTSTSPPTPAFEESPGKSSSRADTRPEECDFAKTHTAVIISAIVLVVVVYVALTTCCLLYRYKRDMQETEKAEQSKVILGSRREDTSKTKSDVSGKAGLSKKGVQTQSSVSEQTISQRLTGPLSSGHPPSASEIVDSCQNHPSVSEKTISEKGVQSKVILGSRREDTSKNKSDVSRKAGPSRKEVNMQSSMSDSTVLCIGLESRLSFSIAVLSLRAFHFDRALVVSSVDSFQEMSCSETSQVAFYIMLTLAVFVLIVFVVLLVVERAVVKWAFTGRNQKKYQRISGGSD